MVGTPTGGNQRGWRPGLPPCRSRSLGHPAGVQDGDMRLADGEAANEGRVEIFYQGQWGTVCDNLWDLTDASVVCRALGFENATEALGRAAFGPGRGPVMLDEVECTGTESSLAECRSLGWLKSNCRHNQDAGVICTNMIRAKAVSVKEVDSGNDIYGNPIKRIQYEVKQIKMFKGPDKDIEFIYTAPSSAVCGVSLDIGGKKEYLIAGKAEGNGKLHVTLCDFIVPWDTLSTTQKKSLNHRYQMGCECKITRCPMIPCYISSPDECLWMDWVTEKNINGHQARFFACIKRSDGSCAWYRGAAPPKQEFLDIEDP
uniref:Metalloproteinase inhibitor 2 n=2 Tax=Suricata suricatta TaxID=37032 RepID=A0A673VM13_SURSU